MNKEKKTNVMRILDKAKIPYITKSYEYKKMICQVPTLPLLLDITRPWFLKPL